MSREKSLQKAIVLSLVLTNIWCGAAYADNGADGADGAVPPAKTGAIGSGGLTGTNWGHGAAKFAYLPEAHTDFAFAVFCQENGFFGALILLLVFCLLGVAFYKITISTRDQKGFLLAAGVTFLIIGQAFANMAMVCGIFPVIGVPLIFISYGGSSMIISMAAIGLLLSVYDEEEKQQLLDAEPPEKRRSDLRVVGSRRWQQ